MPDTIVAIGPNAFNYFDGLEEVSLSESLTHIYAGAFSFCKALKEMEFPVSMVMIDDRAFYDCESLSRINLYEGLECIGEECFGNCANLEEVTLPTSVLYVCEGAFGGCEQLKTLTLAENTVMHEDVFQGSPFDSDTTIPDLVYYDVERPNYEFDIGALGDEIEYFYYKYMLGYVSDEIWSKRAVSSDIFDVVQLERLPEVGQVLSSYLDANFDVGAKSSVAETPVPEEAWAEAYYEAVSQYPYSGILDYALDISKISALCSDNGGEYISDAIVLNAVMSAYVVISGDEPETYEEYRSFEEFYLSSDLSRSDNTIIERLFYEPDAELVRFPLSFVQKALDFLYSVGTFDARRLSDEVGCYLPEDSQYMYMQILSDMSESKVYCRLAEVRYQDNEAILFMNVVGSRYEEGYTVLYDYTNQTALVKEEGSVSYGGSGPIGRVENEGIDLDELGIVKLRLFRDSDGIHIKNFRIVGAE